MPLIDPDSQPARTVPQLETPRLRLRPPARSDLAEVVRLASDGAVAEGTARIPHPYRAEDAEAWWRSLAGTDGRPPPFVFVVERKHDGAFLGVISLEPAPGGGEAEFALWLGRPFWNQGYATEAGRRLFDWAFEEAEIVRIEACAFLDNRASMRVQEKLGMTSLGRAIRAAPARCCGGREAEVRALRREDRPR